MIDKSTKPKRPSSITLICVLGIYGAFLLFWIIFFPSLSSAIERLGLGQTLYLGFSAVGLLVCMIGLWLMKKWSVYAYAAVSVINQVALLLMGRWNLVSLFIPVIVLYVGYKHFSKLS